MPLTFTAAHSSRVNKNKSKRKTAFDRSAATSFARLARRQPSTSGRVRPPTLHGNASDNDEDEDEDDRLFSQRLEDRGLITTLATDLTLRDVVPTIQHIRASMFDAVPLERSGLDSTRTSAILRFRQRLPPLVTAAHVHAVVQSPTSVEREIAALARAGLVRRVTLPGRGAATRDALALTSDWVAAVKAATPPLPDALRDALIAFLHSGESDAGRFRAGVTDADAAILMRAGFLTASSTALRASTNVFAARHNLAGSLTSFDSVARAASGSAAAVGGADAVLGAGGGGGGGSGATGGNSRGVRGSNHPATTNPAMERPPLSSSSAVPIPGASGVQYDVQLTLPSTGPYMKLVAGARAHLGEMLARTAFREAPADLLRARWDGDVDQRTYGRRRDPFASVLPAKLRKWKEFYGLRFDWVLAEALGAGTVEVFDTGSVGRGVRIA